MKQSLKIYESSRLKHEGTHYALGKGIDNKKLLVVQGDVSGFKGEINNGQMLCDLSAENAVVLRSRLPWLNPVPLGIKKSFGFGDRLGQATAGHVASLRQTGGSLAPIFAQQSVRENTRIGRTPQQVMDDALWGLVQSGWLEEWGADADHIKEAAHIAPFVNAGYTFYTIDPSDYVDNEAQVDDSEALWQKVHNLPWQQLQTSYEAFEAEYVDGSIALDSISLQFSRESLARALAKYGRALAYTVEISNEINRQLGGRPFDLEMSVDETDTPTSIEEHYLVANELLKRDVPVVSLAPRFVGKFQKGVDYMGDLDEFANELNGHTAVMRHFDCYKLSIHTGSDKFSIYGIVNEAAGGKVHVKTAGTSYLEALRVVSQVNPQLFREILDLGHQQFEIDRKTYFLDCRPENVPAASDLSDQDLPALLEDFDARQLLHVTFGSALDVYGNLLHATISANEDAYDRGLAAHFTRHLLPFSS